MTIKEKLEEIARMTNDMGIINPHDAKLLLSLIADVEKMREEIENTIKGLQSKHDVFLGTKGESHRQSFKHGLSWAIESIRMILDQPDIPPQDKFGDCSKLEEALEQSNKEYANQCPPECKWELYSEEENVYGTSCDNLYQIMNGSPKDNEMEYCSYCGKKIALKPDSPPYNADPHHKR